MRFGRTAEACARVSERARENGSDLQKRLQRIEARVNIRYFIARLPHRRSSELLLPHPRTCTPSSSGVAILLVPTPLALRTSPLPALAILGIAEFWAGR